MSGAGALRGQRSRYACALLVAALGTPASVFALGDVSWKNASGGVFQTGSNWNGGKPPGKSDRAVFGLAKTYIVEFAADAETAGFTASAGQVTLDLQGWKYLLGGGVDIFNSGTSLDLLGNYEQTGGYFDLHDGALLTVGGSFNKVGDGVFHVRTTGFSIGDPANSTVEAGPVDINVGAQVELKQLTANGDVNIADPNTSLSLLGNYEQTSGRFDVHDSASLTVGGSFNKVGDGVFHVRTTGFSIGDPANSTVEAGPVDINVGAQVELKQLTANGDVNIADPNTSLSLLGNYEQTSGRFDVRDQASMTVEQDFSRVGAGMMTVGSDSTLQVGSRFDLGTDSEFFVNGSVNVGEGAAPENGVLRVGPEGVLAGGATIHGELLIDGGTVEPGNSPGVLAVEGDYTQTEGTLEIELGGNNPGTDYDQLAVSGAANLGGTILLRSINDFKPQIGDTFLIITADSFSGTFSTIDSPDFDVKFEFGPDGLVLEIAPPPVRADMNCDESVDFNDIDPFVAALISRDDYESQYPDCNWFNGDINQDASVDFNDIDGFVECLINGGCE